VSDDAYAALDDPASIYNSAWEEPSYGEPMSDGSGDIWAWDAANGGAPEQKRTPEWEPWTGPAGYTVHLGVDETIGLWPSRLSFSGEVNAAIEASIPVEMGTFLPVGWSPSGEFFAVRAGDPYEGMPSVAIFSAKTGSLVASVSAEYDYTDAEPEIYADLDGVVWDAEVDSLWVFQSTYGAAEDSTQGIEVARIDASGATTPFSEVPDEWRNTMDTAVGLGRDSRGGVVAVDAADGQTVWRVRAQGAERVFDADPSSITFFSNAYSPTAGLLARVDTGEFLGAPLDSKAVTVDMRGKSLRDVWPLGQ